MGESRRCYFRCSILWLRCRNQVACVARTSRREFSRETTRRAWLAVGKHCAAIGAVAAQTALDLPAFLPSAHWLLLLIVPWRVQRAGPKETAVFSRLPEDRSAKAMAANFDAFCEEVGHLLVEVVARSVQDVVLQTMCGARRRKAF